MYEYFVHTLSTCHALKAPSVGETNGRVDDAANGGGGVHQQRHRHRVDILRYSSMRRTPAPTTPCSLSLLFFFNPPQETRCLGTRPPASLSQTKI